MLRRFADLRRSAPWWRAGLALALLVALVACGQAETPHDDGAPPAGTGTVVVNLEGDLPLGAEASVDFDGTTYTGTVTDGIEIAGVPAGTYDVDVPLARVDGTYVPTVYEPDVAALQVSVDEDQTTTVTLTYALRAGSGHLWLATEGGLVGVSDDDLSAGQLTAGGIEIDVPAPSDGADLLFEGITIDGSGNLWTTTTRRDTEPDDMIAIEEANDVLVFAREQLSADAIDVEAVLTISSDFADSVDFLVGLAFDDDGDLWVAARDPDDGLLLEFEDVVSLVGTVADPESVTRTPRIVEVIGMTRIQDLAFDADGDLWIVGANGTAANTVARIPASDLTSALEVTPDPALTLPDEGDARDVEFAADGRLYLAGYLGTAGQILRFDTPESIDTTSTPDATIPVVKSLDTELQPISIAIDMGADLWLMSFDTRDIARLDQPAEQSGQVRANPVVEGLPVIDFGRMIFSPPPLDVPIRTP